jgi:hypothetical protein
MNERPRTLMNGRESAVGTHPAYQAPAAKVNRNRSELRCKKKELWIFHHILWKTAAGSPNRSLPAPLDDGAGIPFGLPGPRTPPADRVRQATGCG